MFRGATKVTLDAKGRMAIPARYREQIASRSDGHLICTIDQDYCLLIYPLPDWEDMERRLIEHVLNQYGGHRVRTAKTLGMGVRTLGLKLKQWREHDEVNLARRPALQAV